MSRLDQQPPNGMEAPLRPRWTKLDACGMQHKSALRCIIIVHGTRTQFTIFNYKWKKSILLHSPIHYVRLNPEKNLGSIDSPPHTPQFQLLQCTPNDIFHFGCSVYKLNFKFNFYEWFPMLKNTLNFLMVIFSNVRNI